MYSGLKLPLHAYQRHALAWMSWRERTGGSSDCSGHSFSSSSQQDSIDSEAAGMFGLTEGALHPCWQPVTLPSGLHIFENRYTGKTYCLEIMIMPNLLASANLSDTVAVTELLCLYVCADALLIHTGF